MKIKDVLDRTAQVVLVDRLQEYNQTSKVEMHIRIAEAWSAVFGRTVTAHEVALCMTMLKVVRAACQPGHEDSYVDGCGYLSIAAEIMHEEPNPIYPPEQVDPRCPVCREIVDQTGDFAAGNGYLYHPDCFTKVGL